MPDITTECGVLGAHQVEVGLDGGFIGNSWTKLMMAGSSSRRLLV